MFVQEDKNWSSDQVENRQYQELARLWNEIHVTLMTAPGAVCTVEIIDRLVFFNSSGELLMVEEYTVEGLNPENTRSLYDIQCQSEEDLQSLINAMESWLKAPSFVARAPEHYGVEEKFREAQDPKLSATFGPRYLTAEVPERLRDLLSRDFIIPEPPATSDFRA